MFAGKYAQLYQKAGCYTAQYILPTRHIFRYEFIKIFIRYNNHKISN